MCQCQFTVVLFPYVEPVVKHIFPVHSSHLACGWRSGQVGEEAAGRERVKKTHSYQFVAFSKTAAFLLFAEFPMLFQCYSHYSCLSQNNIFKQRNGLSRERRGSAARAGQLHALLCLRRGGSELPEDANGRLPGRWQFPVFQAILLPQRQAWQFLPDSPQWCFLGASFGFAQLAAGLAEKRLLSFLQRGSLNTSKWLPATQGT